MDVFFPVWVAWVALVHSLLREGSWSLEYSWLETTGGCLRKVGAAKKEEEEASRRQALRETKRDREGEREARSVTRESECRKIEREKRRRSVPNQRRRREEKRTRSREGMKRDELMLQKGSEGKQKEEEEGLSFSLSLSPPHDDIYYLSLSSFQGRVSKERRVCVSSVQAEVYVHFVT